MKDESRESISKRDFLLISLRAQQQKLRLSGCKRPYHGPTNLNDEIRGEGVVEGGRREKVSLSSENVYHRVLKLIEG